PPAFHLRFTGGDSRVAIATQDGVVHLKVRSMGQSKILDFLKPVPTPNPQPHEGTCKTQFQVQTRPDAPLEDICETPVDRICLLYQGRFATGELRFRTTKPPVPASNGCGTHWPSAMIDQNFRD
ncbi:hypothetical protein HAX54_027625, partial [Datura stramonium]|nr:hypothetical protein [Datura stramonium]